ncbi:MAG: VanZ family protein, partial [Gemmatimonadota bacterium]
GRTHTIWLVLALLAIFAGADELHQRWIRGRMPSPGDWIADVLGVGAGIAIGIRFRRPNRQIGSGIDRETDS